MTTFQNPLKAGSGPTGDPTQDDVGYVELSKSVPLTSGTRTTITFPPKTSIISLGALVTSAFSGVDTAASAMNVNFGTSADPTGFGIVQVSGTGGNGWAKFQTPTSGATMDSGGAMVLTLSALSTTTFTAGGVRAFVRYIVAE